MKSPKEPVILFNHLVQDKTVLFMTKLSQTRIGDIYLFLKKIAFNLPHDRRTAEEKRGSPEVRFN